MRGCLYPMHMFGEDGTRKADKEVLWYSRTYHTEYRLDKQMIQTSYMSNDQSMLRYVCLHVACTGSLSDPCLTLLFPYWLVHAVLQGTTGGNMCAVIPIWLLIADAGAISCLLSGTVGVGVKGEILHLYE